MLDTFYYHTAKSAALSMGRTANYSSRTMSAYHSPY